MLWQCFKIEQEPGTNRHLRLTCNKREAGALVNQCQIKKKDMLGDPCALMESRSHLKSLQIVVFNEIPVPVAKSNCVDIMYLDPDEVPSC